MENYRNMPREDTLLDENQIRRILRRSNLDDLTKEYMVQVLSNLGASIRAIIDMRPEHWRCIGISQEVGIAIKEAFDNYYSLCNTKIQRIKKRIMDNRNRQIEKYLEDKESEQFLQERIERRQRIRKDKMLGRINMDSVFGKRREIRGVKRIVQTKKNWKIKEVDKIYDLLYKALI